MPTPSLVNIPFITAPNVLFSQIPESGAGDFTVTRATTPDAGQATRVNAAGLIETVADNVPRLDYPLGGISAGCPALLVEPSAANGILNSSDLTGANWNVGVNLTRAAASIVGLNGANLTVVTVGSGVGSSVAANVRSANDISLTSGLTYTISFFVRITGTHTIAGYYVPITGAAAGALGGGFDVSGAFPTGVVYGTANVTNRIRRVEAWGGGVFRCSETFTMGANGLLTNIFLAPIVAVNNQSSSAVGTQLAFAGPQVEQGSLPTSFIPTAASPVTRSADVIRKTNIPSLIGQSEGTVYFEVEVTDEARHKWFFTLDSASNSFIQAWISPSRTINIQIQNNVSVVMTQLTSSALSVGYHKVAFAYNTATNGCEMFIDGVQNPVASRTVTGAGLPAFNNFTFGSYLSTQNDTLKAHVRAGALYPNRLSNLRLEFLTAPVTYTTYAQMANALSYILP